MGSGGDVRNALIGALGAKSAEIANEAGLLIEGSIEEIRLTGVGHDWIDRSNRGHDETIRHLLAHPEDLDFAEPPLGATSLVRELARRNFPLYEIIRGYQIGHAHWMKECTRLLAEITDSTAVFASEIDAVFDISYAYLDRTCHQIAEAYEDERGRWLVQGESVRLGAVTALLDDTGVDIPESEKTLAYRLRQDHVAVIAWVDSDVGIDGELARAERVIATAGRAVQSRGNPLVVSKDARTLWAWIPGPAKSVTALELASATAEEPSVKLALGMRADGVAGFVSSHRQALAAAEVGRVSTRAQVYDYADVSALVFLTADIERSRRWIREVLGRLADDTEREKSLRDTLRTYLRTGRSMTAAARALNCHKNTVVYRLRLIERTLGEPIDANIDTVGLGLALHAHQWLGVDDTDS